MISLICCYNNYIEYNYLLKSLQEQQNVDFEIVEIDNSKNCFTSASSALNFGAEKATGDILVFLHQDIEFNDKNSLYQLVDSIENVKGRELLVGLFGASHEYSVRNMNNFREVETLDECLVAMKKETWEKIKFNEQICDGWHLYVVEFCLRASQFGVVALEGNFKNITQLSHPI